MSTEPKNMPTDAEINVAILAWLGWSRLRYAGGRWWGTRPGYNTPDWTAGQPGDTRFVPDHPRDLNAMHEAEKNAPQQYWVQLWWDTVGRMEPMIEENMCAYAGATAQPEMFQ